MLKKCLKKVVAIMMAGACFLISICAYAEGVFNPLYSGILKATNDIYMDVSERDAIMNNVLYADTPTTNKFLTISNASNFIFTKEYFTATYNHKGEYTDLEGGVVGYSPDLVIIQTREVHPTYVLGFILQGVYIEYNNDTYYST